MDPLATYEALCALRSRGDHGAPELARHWLVVDSALRDFAKRRRVGTTADREDAHQETLLKVSSRVHTLKADAPLAALAWLKTVHDRVLFDFLRSQQRSRARIDSPYPGHEGPSRLERLEAPPEEDARVHDDAELEPFEAALFEALEDYTNRSHPRHRGVAFYRAQLAYRKVVKGESVDDLHAERPDLARDTLYQWLRRGRVQVLLPAVEAWLETLPADSDEQAFAAKLVVLLRDADRADAGQPRHERRKNLGSVSPQDHCKSAQYDDEADDD
ncbi:MAG: hypothetical protein H5U40_04745 [Polyangiaceae bacterium]|nr:hypothetical protein [Polyangiaceae bacterium]